MLFFLPKTTEFSYKLIFQPDCPVRYSWAQWSTCSKSCDVGKRIRQRICNDDFTREECESLPAQEEACNEHVRISAHN